MLYLRIPINRVFKMQSLIERHCSKEWQEFINFHKKIIEFDKNEYIFTEGEEVEGIHFIQKGKAKVVTSTSDNGQRLIRLARDSDILGHRGLTGNWKYPISCICLEPTSVAFIPIEVFNTMAKTNAEFSYEFAMFLAQELRLSEEKMAALTAKQRVIKALILNYEAFGFSDQVPHMLSYTLSRKDYASKAGTTYETVVRVLSELNKKKIIKITNKNIIIPSLKHLYKELDLKS